MSLRFQLNPPKPNPSAIQNILLGEPNIPTFEGLSADQYFLPPPRTFQIAARNGIDLVSYLKLKERANTSRILAALNRHAAFKLSFAIAFALSAFMSF